jgi:UDP-N-acetylmuramoyl-tripeptide--D-alanyl-D-alanine ligase
LLAITLIDVCSAVTGRPNFILSPWESITSITHSSTEAVPDSLFVAIKGQRTDGHKFVQEACDAGSICAVVEKYVDVDIPQLLVPSSVEAMGSLARLYHSRLNVPVVAVTGSVGKTTTKEMIAFVLQSKYKVHKSYENYNNELGVPHETFRLNNKDQISIFEIAMRGRNQISYLSKIIRPRIGVITNIGVSHIEKLGSLNEIALAKMEIVDGMDINSTLILNRDDKRYDQLASVAKGKVVSFGENKAANFRISNIQSDENGRAAFEINGVPVRMQVSSGRHFAYNAAAAFAVAQELEMSPDEIKARIGWFESLVGRGNQSNSSLGAIIFDNTYNAAPDSIRSSLYTLSDLKGKGKRTIAVIGDMLELGEYSEEAHREVGKYAKEISLDVLVTVGQSSKFVGEEAGAGAWQHCATALQATKLLLEEVRAEDVILIQGSRALLMDSITRALERGSV